MSSLPNNIYTPRRIASFGDVLRKKYPNIKAIARGYEYEDIKWENPNDALTLTKSVMESQRIAVTIEDWITILFDEANQLQEFASTYHSFSKKEMSTVQITIYQQKYTKCKQYIDARALAADPESVPIPDMIANEATTTGDAPVDLANAVIQNYLNSDGHLSAYYGQIEGIRRMAKRTIMSCQSIAELNAVAWAIWPEYSPPPIDVGD